MGKITNRNAKNVWPSPVLCPGAGVVATIEKLTGESVPLHNCDLRDRASIEQVFGQYCNTENRVTCVIHFAALKAVGESCREPLKYYQNNVTGRIETYLHHVNTV